MKPPFAYYGGKTTLAATIAGLLPAHGHYVEPFAGSLAVLLNKAPSRMETVNDLDGDLMGFWQVLRDRPADLARVCALSPHSRAEWEACAEFTPPADHPDPQLEAARRLWVRLAQARTGRLTRTGWRHYVDPGATGTAFPGYLDGYVDRMAAAANRLHHVSLEARPAAEVITSYGARPGVLLYLDPPYLGSTRNSDRVYRHELVTDTEHRDLAALLRNCRAAVVLSGYPSDLYDHDLYPDWHRATFPAATGQGGTWANRTEVLWSNRPLAAADTLFGDEAA